MSQRHNSIQVLITGGAGFIGSSLSQSLITKGLNGIVPNITAVDNLHPQVHRERIRPQSLPDQVELLVRDVCDALAWDDYFASVRPDVVIHLAAETGTGQSLSQSARHTNVNVTGAAVLLDAMMRAGVRPGHLVLASSRAVYGEGSWQDPVDGTVFYPRYRTKRQLETGLFDIRTYDGRVAIPIPHDSVGTVALPNNVYGATKLAQEHVFAAWANANSIPLSILRLQNVFGAGQSVYNSYTGVLTLFHRLAADREAIEVYEDGHIGRDFIYINDVVTAFVAALERPPAEMRIVDVGTGVATTIHAAARLIAMAYGAPEPRVSGAFRHGDVRWAVCDPSQLAEQLGVIASIDFARGTQLLAEWLFETGLLSGKV